MKELGVVVYNCSSLAKDLQKIFQSYWVMGQSNSSLPQPWPAKYDTAINQHHPLLVKSDNVSSRLYLTVSSLQDTVILMDDFIQHNLQTSNCCHMEARFYEPNLFGGIIIPFFHFTPGFSTIILSSIEDSGPRGYSLHHLRGPALCRCSRHGVLPHHSL